MERIIDHKMTSLADQIFAELERQILIGEYERDELLTEIRLCEKLGVSRTPVREALRRLDQEHIIELTSRGARVIGITLEDLNDIYEIRIRIEGLAARRAAERATANDIEKLRHILELQEFYTRKNEPDQIKNTDSDFHQLLYQMSGSPSLQDTLEPLHRRVIKYRRVSVSSKSRAEKSYQEHLGIFNAIANKDADMAEELTRQHILNARNSILGGK